jgi:sugar-specific transcriptional regulator TrmB
MPRLKKVQIQRRDDSGLKSEDDYIERSIELIRSTAKLSNNEAKILIQLVLSSPLTGKELSEELMIPDSKVYPSLSILQDLKLIISSGERPARYRIEEVEKIIDIINIQEQKRIDVFNSNTNELGELLVHLWRPEETDRQEGSYIIKDKLASELLKLIKTAKNRIDLIISQSLIRTFSSPMLYKSLHQALVKGIKVNLAVPSDEFMRLDNSIIEILTEDRGMKIKPEIKSEFEKYINKKQLIIKKSTVTSNSYIIKDRTRVAHVFHHPIQSFAIISSEMDFVNIIADCWKEGSTCVVSS